MGHALLQPTAILGVHGCIYTSVIIMAAAATAIWPTLGLSIQERITWKITTA